MTPHRAWIALGSNLGDREGHILAAVHGLTQMAGIRLAKLSTFIETDPVGPGAQRRYINAAAELSTSMTPRELLAALQGTEVLRGRTRSTLSRNTPRTIDLDLLLYENQVIDEPGLTVPHPRMHERAFVLRPLVEIAGEVVHPALNATIRELLERLDRPSKSA